MMFSEGGTVRSEQEVVVPVQAPKHQNQLSGNGMKVTPMLKSPKITTTHTCGVYTNEIWPRHGPMRQTLV